MKKSTQGIVIGSLAVGFVGGLAYIKRCVRHKHELSDRERVEFKYLGKQGVSDVLNSMSDKEVKDIARAVDVLEAFDTRVRSQRAELLSSAVNATLGIEYTDFMDIMLSMYDSDEEVLNQPFCKLIDDYFEITGENMEADGEETCNEARQKLNDIDPILKDGINDDGKNFVKAMVEPAGDFNMENYMNKPEGEDSN